MSVVGGGGEDVSFQNRSRGRRGLVCTHALQKKASNLKCRTIMTAAR